MHRSCTDVVIDSSVPIYRLDTLAETISSIIRIVCVLSIDRISFGAFMFSYFFSAATLVISSAMFCSSIHSHSYHLYFAAWFLNRAATGLISATRDYIVYKLSYKTHVNIPLIKALKTLGNVFTILHPIIFLTASSTTILIVSSSVINLLLSSITIYVAYNYKHLFQENEKDESSGSLLKNVTLQRVMIVFFTSLICSLNQISDQVVFVEMKKHSTNSANLAMMAKFCGQTIIGISYSIFLKNNLFAAITSPLFCSLGYLLFTLKTLHTTFFAGIIWGLMLIIRHSSLVIIPRFMADYNQIYQVASFFAEPFGALLASIIFEYLKSYANLDTSYIMFASWGVFCFLANVFMVKKFKK